jgi:hypothetical protein
MTNEMNVLLLLSQNRRGTFLLIEHLYFNTLLMSLVKTDSIASNSRTLMVTTQLFLMGMEAGNYQNTQ